METGMGKQELTMAIRPKGKENKPYIGFRCPPDLEKWLRDHEDEKGGVSLTDVIVWAIGYGRDFIEAAGDTAHSIKEIAERDELVSRVVLREILELGIAEYEKRRAATVDGTRGRAAR